MTKSAIPAPLMIRPTVPTKVRAGQLRIRPVKMNNDNHRHKPVVSIMQASPAWLKMAGQVAPLGAVFGFLYIFSQSSR